MSNTDRAPDPHGSGTDPEHQRSEDTPGDPPIGVHKRLGRKLDAALDAVAQAAPFARSRHQTQVFQIAEALMGTPGGLRVLYEQAHRFDGAGVFDGGPWVDPARLQPPLVEGSLVASGVYPVVETLSELRVLAIATGRVESERMSADEARRFLEEVMALNLRFLFPGDTEQERVSGGPHRASNEALFSLLAEELSLTNLRREVVAEITAVSAQRPIMTSRLRRMIEMAARIPTGSDEEAAARDQAVDARLEVFTAALRGPGPLARRYPSVRDYRKAIPEIDVDTLAVEADACGESMRQTGIVSDHHAVLLRWLIQKKPRLAARALALTPMGAASLEQNLGATRKLVKVAILPSTSQAVYGLSRIIDRGLLARREIRHGLTRIVDMDLDRDVRRLLLSRKTRRDGLTANAMLTAGCIAVLGQPLGIGQGHNPTCQAARGLSLWAQHAPGYLLGLVVSAARDGHIAMDFEGQHLRSDKLGGGLARSLDPELDPVSLVLVPHLDRLYDEMMRRVALRGEDGHKWVNPALYGRWISHGFASIFLDIAQTTVSAPGDFVRRFFATHHPAYNDGNRLMYPNPLGLCVTNGHGDYLGAHAISLQRVAEDPDGKLRAYFYNPNNEGRQDWGRGVSPSVNGHGEREGESSLPFHQLASRIYAFHFNPFEVGDGYAVPDEEIEEIVTEARETWGQAFVWV